jgi:aminoglycoside phosphotransferase (APT) family kinase protein
MSEPVWRADIAIDGPLAARLIAAQFPALAGAPIVPFGSGWDNTAFLVDDRLVFRFPRRRVVARLIEREIAVLPLIAPHLPLPISAPAFCGTPSPDFPWAFAGYERIAGTTACALVLDDATRAALAVPIAHFLRDLHRLDTASLVAAGLPPDEIGRLDAAKRLPLTRERLLTLETARIGGARTAVEWLAANPPEPLENSQRCVVHGDLYARHVLLECGQKAAGIIDWGDVHLGDPALDITIAYMMLPASAHAAFRDAYGGVDERTWRAARYRALYHAILQIDYGIRENDAGMRGSGTTALRLAAAAS